MEGRKRTGQGARGRGEGGGRSTSTHHSPTPQGRGEEGRGEERRGGWRSTSTYHCFWNLLLSHQNLILLQAFYRKWYLLSIISLARGRVFGRDSPTHSSPPRPATSILLGPCQMEVWGRRVSHTHFPPHVQTLRSRLEKRGTADHIIILDTLPHILCEVNLIFVKRFQVVLSSWRDILNSVWDEP